MKLSSHAWIVVVNQYCHASLIASKVSQEAYTLFGDAVAFCESRNDGPVFKKDSCTFSTPKDEYGCYIEYKITNIYIMKGEAK